MIKFRFANFFEENRKWREKNRRNNVEHCWQRPIIEKAAKKLKNKQTNKQTKKKNSPEF